MEELSDIVVCEFPLVHREVVETADRLPESRLKSEETEWERNE